MLRPELSTLMPCINYCTCIELKVPNKLITNWTMGAAIVVTTAQAVVIGGRWCSWSQAGITGHLYWPDWPNAAFQLHPCNLVKYMIEWQQLSTHWGAVTVFLWGQRLYCEGKAQNKHHVRGTTASCEEQLLFQVNFLCTCEVILHKTLPIECPGISSIQCDVTFMLTSSRIWETVATNVLQRRYCEVKLEY